MPPLIIGLTGGIACGKTTASDFFADKGVEIVDADLVAREVVEPGQPGLTQVVDAFGESILQDDGALDRQKMRDIVFADEHKRKLLESILHPLIRQRLKQQLAQAQGAYVIFSVPLLVESGMNQLADRVLVIDVSDEAQLLRLIERDGASRQQAEAIIAAQISRDLRNDAADDIIDNSGSLEHFLKQLESCHQRYVRLSAKRAH
ncbi:MAG: dephospho-CoA kinase [Gammaproteobacteria bacterium]